MCNVPFEAKIGGAFAVTWPVICADAVREFSPSAVAAIVTCGDIERGVHVPEKIPDVLSTAVNASGSSPFENDAEICASVKGVPQSVISFKATSTGHPSGCWKL
jgi:hypothetical protein